MRGNTARLARGISSPLHPPDQGEPSCPPVEPPEQEPSRPCTLDRDDEHMRPPHLFVIPPRSFALPWNPPTADCSGHNQRAFMPLGTQTKEPSCPLETRPGIANPGPPAGISRLLPTKAVPWNPSLEEGGWRQEVTNGNGRASLRSV